MSHDDVLADVKKNGWAQDNPLPVDYYTQFLQINSQHSTDLSVYYLLTCQYNSNHLTLDGITVENYFFGPLRTTFNREGLTLCISEETVLLMDSGIAAISELFLTELHRDENDGEDDISKKLLNATLYTSGTLADDCQDAA